MSALDVVIPVRPGPNEELRFALRSLTNLPHRRVHILGAAPSWVDRSEVRVVPRRHSARKWDTVTDHLVAACTDQEISDPFVLLNDDIFTVEPIDAVPALNRGPLVDVIEEYEGRGVYSSYVTSMVMTHRRLLEHFPHDRELMSFELHVPLVVDKGLMLAAIALGEGVERWHRRTAYGVIAGLAGERVPDVKVNHPDDAWPDGPFVSTSDASFPWVRPRLRNLFPDRGPYERGNR